MHFKTMKRQKDKFKEMKVIKPTSPLNKLLGLWKDKGISLEKIRKKAWQRHKN